MKKRTVAAFLLFCGVVLLAGCQSSGTQMHTENYQQGVDEVNVRFLDNLPPEELYPNTRFAMMVEVRNEMGYDIQNGYVKVVGLNPKYVELYPLAQPFLPLKGKSAMMPEGEKAFLEFQGMTKELTKREEHEEKYLLKVGYTSHVTFADTVCINPNLYRVYDGGCVMEPSTSYSGQGAPLAVTTMEEIILPGGGEAEFRFLVRNRGDGYVGTIGLQSAQLGGKEMECEFLGKSVDGRVVTLSRKKQEAVLVCKAFIRDIQSYTTTLSASFAYDYELDKVEEITIVRT